MTRTPIHQFVTIMVETNGEMEKTLSKANVPTLTSAMITGKLFDIDYSKVWNRHEYEFQILVGKLF